MKKESIKNRQMKIEKVAEFDLAMQHNVERLVIALGFCGYLTKVYTQSTGYMVIVYKII